MLRSRLDRIWRFRVHYPHIKQKPNMTEPMTMQELGAEPVTTAGLEEPTFAHSPASAAAFDELTDQRIQKCLAEAVKRAAAEAKAAADARAAGTAVVKHHLKGRHGFNPDITSFSATTAAVYLRQRKALATQCGIKDTKSSIAQLAHGGADVLLPSILFDSRV